MSERKNSPLDILVIVFFTLLFCGTFGVAVYFIFVYMILPLAVEFIPALDTWLTRVGRENDTAEIYRTIYQVCALLAVIPAICSSCTLVKFRERVFIKETGGTIPPRAGFAYHLKNHFRYDAIAAVIIVALGLLVHLFDKGVGASPFHILYCRLGVIPAVLISAVMTVAALLLGIIIAQNSWRADHFFGD